MTSNLSTFLKDSFEFSHVFKGLPWSNIIKQNHKINYAYFLPGIFYVKILIYLDFIFGIKSGIGIQFAFLQMVRLLLPNGYIK